MNRVPGNDYQHGTVYGRPIPHAEFPHIPPPCPSSQNLETHWSPAEHGIANTRFLSTPIALSLDAELSKGIFLPHLILGVQSGYSVASKWR